MPSNFAILPLPVSLRISIVCEKMSFLAENPLPPNLVDFAHGVVVFSLKILVQRNIQFGVSQRAQTLYLAS
jgi:hypothetical protein